MRNSFSPSSFKISTKSLAVFHLDSPTSFLIKRMDASAIWDDDVSSLKKNLIGFQISKKFEKFKSRMIYFFLRSLMSFLTSKSYSGRDIFRIFV